MRSGPTSQGYNGKNLSQKIKEKMKGRKGESEGGREGDGEGGRWGGRERGKEGIKA